MRYSTLLCALMIWLVSCKPEKPVPVNDTFVQSLLKKYDRGMILSCFRCSCIDSFLISKQTIPALKMIPLLGDTGCIKNRYEQVYYIAQKDLDSIWDRNFNILLFKTVGNKKIFSNLKTEDNLKAKASAFFEKNTD